MEEKKFDINTFIGFLLIGGILVWMTWGTADEAMLESQQADSTATKTEQTNATETEVPTETIESSSQPLITTDSSGNAVAQAGVFAMPNESSNPPVLSNEHVSITLDPVGAAISRTELLEYKTYAQEPLTLMDEGNHRINWSFNYQGGIYNTADLTFETLEKSNSTVHFRLSALDGAYLDVIYTLTEEDYHLNQRIEDHGLLGSSAKVDWSYRAHLLEKSLKNERNNTAIYYKQDGDDVDDMGLMGSDASEEKNIDWIAFKQQFFASILVPDTRLSTVSFDQTQPEDENSTVVKDLSASFDQQLNGSVLNYDWYFLPTQFGLLKEYENDFEELVPLGWGIFGWVNQWMVIPVFNLFDGWGWNYGIIILVMALGVKLILSPFQIKSYVSMAKMRVLKPEMDEINKKHEDPMKRQQAVMELYRKTGANPLGGCLPMLFQLPFLIAMFRFFPASIELRQEQFLWADDLSSFDSIASLPFDIPFYGDHISLFTLLMAASLFFYTRLNQQMTPSAGDNAMAKQMKVIQYLMPFMMLFWFNSYASGLSYYYFLANVISFGQQFAIRRFFIDEDEIHRQIQEKKQQPAKKSKFQQRLDAMMKEQGKKK